MFDLTDKQVLVVGLGASGRAACKLLRRRGASVLAVDSAEGDSLDHELGKLKPLGIEVALGVVKPPTRAFNLAVVSPAVPRDAQFLQELARRNVPVIGELELGYQQAQCLSIAIGGSNGKATTAGLVERILAQNGRKILLAGSADQPLCAVVEQSKELDFLVLRVTSFQLDTTRFFRPAVAVLLNLASDHLDRYGTMENYVRSNALLFRNQQPFDWAIVQSEALQRLRALHIKIPSKVIAFSATDHEADIFLDRGLLISRLPDWSGPLLNIDHCQLRGRHNAENLMAALAVGRVLRVPLELTLDAVKSCAPRPHCCEQVAEFNGVKFINDAKATNLLALQNALLAAPAGKAGGQNIWLIAGGRDKGFDYHDVGPVLSQRVKGAFLIGEAREKLRAAWGLFTPCAVMPSLLEAVAKAVKQAVPGDVVLFSPACSSFDQFRNYRHRGEVYRQAVKQFGATTACGRPVPDHNGQCFNGAAQHPSQS